MNCLICNHPMSAGRPAYWFECNQCGFLCSTLRPSIGHDNTAHTIDEPARRQALHPLRRANFEYILNELALMRTGKRTALLDVGCGHGWFLQVASRHGFQAVGIEPDAEIAIEARASGSTVICGFFPSDLPAHVRYDIISFNDVFEHLPEPDAAAPACFHHLAPGGLLAITLPSSRGIFFRTAYALARIGLFGSLDRLWQRGFPSPHLTYFHPDGLSTFLARHGFREIHRASLLSLLRAGLWQRIRYDRNVSLPSSLILFTALTLLSPFVPFLPPDISFQVFERLDDPSPSGEKPD